MSQKTVALEVRSPPDGMGRRYFVARWFDEGFHLGPMQREEHCIDALLDGCDAEGPCGHPARVDDDVELYEAQP